ncbi:MAG TPA: DUF72 domain-containing protein [Actinomycetota bacterium]|jgi:uncharacterized protein YecE (DUF72 family)
MWFVGTSGWHYKDWKARFYPDHLATSEWLAFYAERFPTVEVNNTFYRLPPEQTFDRWAAETPPGFVFSVKASRYITHIRRLADPRDALEVLLTRARHLGDRLGPILVQLPPNAMFDPERLRGFLAALPPGVRAAIEFRHASWERSETYELLDEARVALVWPDRPGARARLPSTGGWCYVRMHQGRRTAPGYTNAKLRRWADRLAPMEAGGYVYFNNDHQGAAVRDAATLTRLLADRGADVASRRPSTA